MCSRRGRRGCSWSWLGGGDAFAEDGGSDADAGAAFFDGYGEVVGHADGELGEGGVESLLLVAEAAEGLEVGAGGLGVFRPGGDGHEAVEPEVGEFSDGVEEVVEVFGRETVLGLFVGEFDFDEDGEGLVEGGGGRVEALGNLDGVDGVDGLEEFGGAGGFVGLEGADEVDFEIGESCDGGGFIGVFLHAVFAEEAVAGGVCFEDAGDGVELADRHQGDFGGGAVGAAAGGVDPVVQVGQIFCDRHCFYLTGIEKR